MFYLRDKQHLSNKLLCVENTQALLVISHLTEGKQLVQTLQAAKPTDCNITVLMTYGVDSRMQSSDEHSFPKVNPT